MTEVATKDPVDVERLVAGGAQLVDVRTEHEWEVGHIEGAVHIELAELNQRAGELDRDRPVVFYCRGDNRSDMAAAAFAADGYEATALAGGIQAWADDGRPLQPEGGYVAESGEAAAIIQARKQAGNRQIP